MPDNTPSWEEAALSILNDPNYFLLTKQGNTVFNPTAALQALNSAVKELVLASKPEKLVSDGSLQEHELIAMLELGGKSLTPREKGTLVFTEAELHQLVVELIAEYHNQALTDYRANIIKAIDGKAE